MDQSGLPEELNGVVGVDGPLFDGHCRRGQFPHPRFHPCKQRLIQGKITPGQNEEGAAEGVFHGDALHILPAYHVVEGLQHQKDCASLIGLNTGLVLSGDHFQRTVPVQGLVELAELSVSVYQQDIPGIPVLKVRRDSAVGRPAGIGVICAVHSDLYHSLFFHGMASSYI